MSNLIRKLGEDLLKEGKNVRFKNERKKLHEFVETLAVRIPSGVSDDRTLVEPFRSLAFLVVVGQRPVTSILLLQIFLKTGRRPLNGKEVGERLAKELKVSSELTTKGGNYKDRVGDLISAFTRIGILESVVSKLGDSEGNGFRISKSAVAEVEAFVGCFKSKKGFLQVLKPSKLESQFKTRFDQKLKYVVKSGTNVRQKFSIGRILKSLLGPKLGISFETALRVIEEIEPKLKTGISTLDIQSMLYNAIKKYDEKAAESYRLIYPEIMTLAMSDGKQKIVNYRLVKTLIDKEVKLKITSNLFDQFAKTVYNVITRNPGNYQNESAVREYIDALVRSECIPVRSDTSFVSEQLESAISALDGCKSLLQSDEVDPARDLFEQFIEQISLVTLVEFGYLPLKDSKQNIDLISNLLKHGGVKRDLKNELRLTEEDLHLFQRIRFLMQMKDSVGRKAFENLVSEGEKVSALCKEILKIFPLRVKRELEVTEIVETTPPRYAATGYKDLDSMMFGGIPGKYAVLLNSPSCDEKDLLIETYLKTGIEEGEIVFYITVDAKGAESYVPEVPSNFYLFICNPEADAIVGSKDNVFKIKGVENLTEIDIALTSALRKINKIANKPSRACIEIISDVLLQHHAVSTRRWLTALVPKLKSSGFTTLAVMNPHMHSSQEVQAILDLFQGEIQMYRRKTEKGLKRFLRIEKMHNQEYSEEELSIKKDRIQRQLQ